MAAGLDAMQTGLDIAAAAVYAYVGWRLGRRRVEGEARLANNLFATWWILLAGFMGLIIVQRFAVSADVTDLAFHMTLLQVALLVLCVALWALLYYLTYVLTGDRRAMGVIASFYALIYVGLLLLIGARHPLAVVRDGQNAIVQYASDADPRISAILVALMLGPVLVAAAGYFRLFFRVEGRTQRYRIALVALTFITWFVTAASANLLGISRLPWWPTVSSMMGLAAAVCVYLAYQPPRFVRRRLGVDALADEGAQRQT